MNEYAVPIFALVGTIFGGAGLEIVRRWLSRSKERDDTATELRKELRDELKELKAENRSLEAEVDLWKGKYWQLRQDLIRPPDSS